MENYKNKHKTSNKMAISTYLSIIYASINELNASIVRDRVSKLMKKQDSSIFCLQKTHFQCKDTHRINKDGGMENQIKTTRKLG